MYTPPGITKMTQEAVAPYSRLSDEELLAVCLAQPELTDLETELMLRLQDFLEATDDLIESLTPPEVAVAA